MQSSESKYGIESQSVIFERFEGEVIAIHLDKGVYYSLNRTASDIFDFVGIGGASCREIVAAAAGKYSGDPEVIEEQVKEFVRELLREQLIRTTVPKVSGSSSSVPAMPEQEKTPFEKPVLEVHKDMQELFLLDPVHDVSEAGWPEMNGAFKA